MLTRLQQPAPGSFDACHFQTAVAAQRTGKGRRCGPGPGPAPLSADVGPRQRKLIHRRLPFKTLSRLFFWFKNPPLLQSDLDTAKSRLQAYVSSLGLSCLVRVRSSCPQRVLFACKFAVSILLGQAV